MQMPWTAPKRTTAKTAPQLQPGPSAPVAPVDQLSLFALEPAPLGKPLTVSIGLLDEDPDNPRTEFPQAHLDELAQDIALRGILQPIVVDAAESPGRYRIRFGSKRWRAAKQAGLTEVPVIVMGRPTDAYDQVAENTRRHGLSALELANFMRGRLEAGESNATVARQLGMDLTSVAHHLALLQLPVPIEAAMKAGRCTSPRTLYELSKLHAEQPDRVEAFLAGDLPLTRETVAQLRDAAPEAEPGAALNRPNLPRPDRTAQMLARANGLCKRLDAALVRLSNAEPGPLRDEALTVLRAQVMALATRLGP